MATYSVIGETIFNSRMSPVGKISDYSVKRLKDDSYMSIDGSRATCETSRSRNICTNIVKTRRIVCILDKLVINVFGEYSSEYTSTPDMTIPMEVIRKTIKTDRFLSDIQLAAIYIMCMTKLVPTRKS